jgi:copper homeostasis protein
LEGGRGVTPATGFRLHRLKYEVCVESRSGVKAALLAGADRVELCRDLAVGGLTPGPGTVEEALSMAGHSLKVHVLVRARPGDFVYSPEELDTMVEQVAAARLAGAHGIVVGALSLDGRVDERATAMLVAAARPASVTFHRAFDEVRDAGAGYDQLAGLGVDRVLTAAGRPSAVEGAEILRRLVDRPAEDAAGRR